MLSVAPDRPLDPLVLTILKRLDPVARELGIGYVVTGATGRDVVPCFATRKNAELSTPGREALHLLRVAMQTLEDKTSILSALNAIRLASLRSWNWIVRLAPVGVSALFAVTAGTTSLLHELRAAVAISAEISRGPAEVAGAVIADTLGARVGRLARRGQTSSRPSSAEDDPSRRRRERQHAARQ